MAKRLNITISDEIYKNLKVFKNKLNISKICQEAIKHTLEFEKCKQELREIGYGDAQKNCKNFDYRDFKIILKGDEETKQQYYDEYLFFKVIIASQRDLLYDELLPPDKEDLKKGVNSSDFESAVSKYNSYMEGFEAGVKEYWEKNKDIIGYAK